MPGVRDVVAQKSVLDIRKSLRECTVPARRRRMIPHRHARFLRDRIPAAAAGLHQRRVLFEPRCRPRHLLRRLLGQRHQRDQGHQQPRPRAHRVVHEIEEQRRADGVFLVLGRQHALRDVAAAARLRARIPDVPPLHRQRQHQHRHQQRRVTALDTREETQLVRRNPLP